MTGVLYDKAIFASACIAFAMLCICSLAQDYKASYWLNKGNESHEMMINETQNRTARDIFLQEARRAYDTRQLRSTLSRHQPGLKRANCKSTHWAI